MTDQTQTFTLRNGLRIAHRHTDSPVMFCGIMVDCGTRHEATPQQFGMAHFIEHILFKGTTTRDSWHINNRMESVGGELNAFTTKEETTFYAVGLNSDFSRACQLLCDLLCHPTAPQHEVEKESEVVIDEIMSYRDNPPELIFDEFENHLWGQTPATRPLAHNILGSADTVRTFGHDDCLAFIHTHYTASRMVFFHQGSTPLSTVVRCLERWFDAPATNPAASPQPPVAQPLQPDAIRLPDTSTLTLQQHTHQAHVLLGVPTFHLTHPDVAALTLLNNILGGPGMNSRLGLELRERRGLVYTVDSSLTTYTDAGYMAIYFGCDHHDVRRCLTLCHHQLDRIADQQLTPRQLLNAQKQLCGQLGIARASLENNAIALGKQLMRKGRIDTLQDSCQLIMDVTAAHLQDVAARVFAQGRRLSVIIC